MTNPYTQHPLDAYMAGQTSIALGLGAVLLYKRAWPAFTRLFLFAALLVATIAPVLGDLVHGIGYDWPADALLTTLEASALLASIAMIAAPTRWLLGAALAGEYGLYRAVHYFTLQNLALCALHVAWIGALMGLLYLAEGPPEEPAPYPIERGYVAEDLTLAAAATLLAVLVGAWVLKRQCDTADEWAYTFQASVFAKLHAYAEKPPCYEALRAFWVYEKDGRLFSQYLPGWPLFMTPFFAAGVFWLAGPCALGVLVAGVARLGRRAVAATIDARSPHAERCVRLGGTLAGASILLSDMTVINGASRYPHIWVCAMFVWAMEGIAMITSPLDPRRQVRWGAVLGCALAWLLATRHGDGCLLGVGMFLYVAIAFARRRLSARSIVATLVPFALFGGFTLVLLRLQLGAWFTTGYSLHDIIHPWEKIGASWPQPHEWRWHFPLDVGAYVWFPMAPAVGFAGLLALARTRERRVAFMMGVGTAATLLFFAHMEYSRGIDFGFGPRYQLVVIVPMAVGAGVVFAPLFNSALSRVTSAPALEEGGPALVAAVAAIVGTVRIASLLFPAATDDVKLRNVVFDAIARERPSNAIIWVAKGQTIDDPLDLTQNLPPELYGLPSVLVLRDPGEPDVDRQARQCVRETYPGRTWYHPQRDGHLIRD